MQRVRTRQHRTAEDETSAGGKREAAHTSHSLYSDHVGSKRHKAHGRAQAAHRPRRGTSCNHPHASACRTLSERHQMSYASCNSLVASSPPWPPSTKGRCRSPLEEGIQQAEGDRHWQRRGKGETATRHRDGGHAAGGSARHNALRRRTASGGHHRAAQMRSRGTGRQGQGTAVRLQVGARQGQGGERRGA